MIICKIRVDKYTVHVYILKLSCRFDSSEEEKIFLLSSETLNFTTFGYSRNSLLVVLDIQLENHQSLHCNLFSISLRIFNSDLSASIVVQKISIFETFNFRYTIVRSRFSQASQFDPDSQSSSFPLNEDSIKLVIKHWKKCVEENRPFFV